MASFLELLVLAGLAAWLFRSKLIKPSSKRNLFSTFGLTIREFKKGLEGGAQKAPQSRLDYHNRHLSNLSDSQSSRDSPTFSTSSSATTSEQQIRVKEEGQLLSLTSSAYESHAHSAVLKDKKKDT